MKTAEIRPLIEQLRRAGFTIIHNAETQISRRRILEAGVVAAVIDLSRMPSSGREVGAWLRAAKSTRNIPIVFVGGLAEKIAAIRKEIPDAVYSNVVGIRAALKTAIASPPLKPVVPQTMMEGYENRTTAQKMGIREGMVVGLIDPPADYVRVLGEMPEGVVLEEDPQRECEVTAWFVHDAGEYEAMLARRRTLAARSRLWVLWQKGRRDGLNSNFVRAAAIAVGLVDYKICSVDSVWTGMAFAVKKARA